MFVRIVLSSLILIVVATATGVINAAYINKSKIVTIPINRVEFNEQEEYVYTQHQQMLFDVKHHDIVQSRRPKVSLFPPKHVWYWGLIGIGQPASNFSVLFDTGSHTLWVPSVRCQSRECRTRKKYNHTVSSTFQATGRVSVVEYGGGDRIYGDQSVDDVEICPSVVIKEQTFVEVTSLVGENLRDYPFDGIFGLNYAPKDDDESFESPIELMVKQGIIDKPLFTFYLNPDANLHSSSSSSSSSSMAFASQIGQLTFGGLNDDHLSVYDGEISYVPLIRSDHWTIRMDSVTLEFNERNEQLEDDPLNDNTIERAGNVAVRVCRNGCNAIVDTGTNFIGGYSVDVERLHYQLGAEFPSNGMFYIIERCDMRKLPDLVLTLNGQPFALKPEQYLVKLDDLDGDGHESCMTLIRAIDPNIYPFWIIGSPFIRNFYGVFDLEEKRVGFANLARRPPSQNHNSN